MRTVMRWRIGRRHGEGLWVAPTLERALGDLVAICHHTGYRRRDVCVWLEGSEPAFWVCEPEGQGGVGAETLDEAVETREEMARLGYSGRHIRHKDSRGPLKAREAAKIRDETRDDRSQ